MKLYEHEALKRSEGRFRALRDRESWYPFRYTPHRPATQRQRRDVARSIATEVKVCIIGVAPEQVASRGKIGRHAFTEDLDQEMIGTPRHLDDAT